MFHYVLKCLCMCFWVQLPMSLDDSTVSPEAKVIRGYELLVCTGHKIVNFLILLLFINESTSCL